MNLSSKLLFFLAQLKYKKVMRRVVSLGHSVEKTQKKVLLSILKDQEHTEYGRSHHFDKIRSVDEFRKMIPVNTYENLRSLIEEQDKTKKAILNAENPSMYYMTSGTTGKAKLIPATKKDDKARNEIRLLQNIGLSKKYPNFLRGKVLAIVSPYVECYTSNGTPCGSVTGKLYETSRIAQKKSVLPPLVARIKDSKVRYRLILQLALQEENITYITTANPSTLLLLISVLNENWDTLMQDLEKGVFTTEKTLTKETWSLVDSSIRPCPERARFLRQVKKSAKNARVRYLDIWKNVELVSVWTRGSCSIFIKQLQKEFKENVLIYDPGYQSSEFAGSFILEPKSSYGVPTFQYNFFEFVEENDWLEGKKNFLGLHEIEEGKRYQVFITTSYGLYRYHMNDILETKGEFFSVPLIRFVEKGSGVTNITGEKLYESQVIKAVKKIEESFALSSSFYLMLASVEDASYTLYYEGETEEDTTLLLEEKKAIVECLEEFIYASNIEYAAKRESGRLKKLQLVPLSSGSHQAYKNYCIQKKLQRSEQWKLLCLQYVHGIGFDFKKHRWQHPVAALDREAKEKRKGNIFSVARIHS